jgi:mRNA interferase MazF
MIEGENSFLCYNISMENKNFDSWNKLKKLTESKNRPIIRNGDIYWCRIGLNVGVEIDGKNDNFKRPVLVLKKFSDEIALVVPLTTKNHSGDWYYNFNFKNIEQWAILNQVKVLDTKRFMENMGQLSEPKLENILNAYIKLIKNKYRLTAVF